MTNTQLGTLYVKYNELMVNYLVKVGFTKEDSEDITHNVWYKLKDYKLSDIRNPKAFLFSVAQSLGNNLRKQNRKTSRVTDKVIKQIVESESLQKWQESEQYSELNDKVMSAVCLAATHVTRFGVSILSIIEDQLNGMTQQQIADKHDTNRKAISIELKEWYKRINSMTPMFNRDQ